MPFFHPTEKEQREDFDWLLRLAAFKDTIHTLLTTLSSIIVHHTSDAVDSYSMSNEPLLLCLGMRGSTTPRLEMSDEDWEDFCQESGRWEWIDGEAEGVARNGFGGESTRGSQRASLKREESHTLCWQIWD